MPYLEKVEMFIVLLAFNLPTSSKRKSALKDEEVVSRIIQSQDPTLIDILYARYVDKVYRKCMSFVKDTSIAEDLTHDIFIKMYMNLGSFKGKSKFSTWLYSITYNFCVDYLRKNRKMKLISIDEERKVVDDMEIENAEDLEFIKAERLLKLLEKVKLDEKMILLMKYRDDLSIKEIQKILKISESAVKMRIKRAKEKVKRLHGELYLQNSF